MSELNNFSMAKKAASYLERLQFDPKQMFGAVAKYITNIRLVVLLILTISLMGLASFLQLPHRLNPEVKIPIITVVTVLPGAGPADVESLVTIPIEDKLRSLKDVDTIVSSSRENVSAISIQFLSTVDRDKAKDNVQSQVDAVNTLPSDAQTPSVTALDFEDQPVLTFAVSTKNSYPDLMRSTRQLKDDLENLSKVDRVVSSGFDDQEIVVTINQNKLSEYSISPMQLSQLIKASHASYPAGSVQTDNNEFALTIDSAVESIDDIRALKIEVNDATFSLADVADVSLKPKLDHHDAYLASSDSTATEAVTFYVYKVVDADIEDAGKQVTTLIDDFTASKGDAYQVTTLADTSHEISKQFTDLLGEFRSTILLVFFTLLLFLGLRQAIISSFTVPLTFLSAFMFMYMVGMSINFLSLFALLLALGLLIDDTIVVVSAMTTYFKTGKFNPVQTGVLVWKDTIVPIWSTTITTIWSFVPLLLSTGIIGEFIKPIPIVIAVTMISSTGIAVLITLPIMIVLLKPVVPKRVITLLQIALYLISLVVIALLVKTNPLMIPIIAVYLALSFLIWKLRATYTQYFQNGQKKISQRLQSKKLAMLKTYLSRLFQRGLIDVEPFAEGYKNMMRNILVSKSSRRKVLIGVIAYAVIGFALLPFGLVKNEFFPKTDGEELFVELELPAGSKADDVKSVGLELLDELRHTAETRFVTMEIGRGAESLNGVSVGNNTILYSLKLTDKDSRDLSSITIAQDLRQTYGDFQKGKVTVTEESSGPPAGADIQITLLGAESQKIDSYANQIVEYLNQQNGVINVSKSIKAGTSKIVFVPDQNKLVQYGLSPQVLGLQLRAFASGLTLDSLNLNGDSSDKKDIVFRMQNSIADAQDLTQIQVTTPRGLTLPLTELGSFVTKVNPTSITREDFKRSMSVSAGVKAGFSVSELNKGLEQFADSMQLDSGYEWKTGGVNEENAKSVQSILQAMLISAILILITMVVQFASFRQAIIVLIVIPLAVSSVFFIFALTGTPLSFPALIGVLSLFGIVVTNSMFIVDKINLNRKEGMEFTESIADAGASRMEPIILTKFCTVFGLLPITIADPLWRGLGGAIISGLLIASTIMLLFIPVLYYSWMKK